MEIINKLVWGLASIVLIVSGIYFSFKLEFLHLNFKEIFKSLKKSSKSKNEISGFESLMVSLGACIGVGSLAGIALAIYKGGVGSLFWLWISCFLVSPNSLVENTLSIIYRKKSVNVTEGGPAYYIKNGLGYQKLAFIYALLVVVAYLFGFLTIQSNTIAKSFTTFLNIPTIIIGIIIGIISFIIIKKGIKGIAKFSSYFVPLMGLIYLAISFYIIIKNINLLPNILINIILSAFNFKAFGYGIISTILIGIQRGIFASEAGTGTAAIASGSSSEQIPIKQGLIGLIGVYFTTFIICTGTAFIILTSNYKFLNYIDVNGIEITQQALIYHLGQIGNIVLYFSLIAFSFSTIISGYYYVENNLKFIFNKISENSILLLKLFTCFILVIGALLSSDFIWNLADILVGILTIINIFAITMLRKDVIIEYISYKRKCKYDRK